MNSISALRPGNEADQESSVGNLHPFTHERATPATELATSDVRVWVMQTDLEVYHLPHARAHSPSLHNSTHAPKESSCKFSRFLIHFSLMHRALPPFPPLVAAMFGLIPSPY